MARSPASPRHRLELALVALIAASVIGLYLVEGSRLLGHLEGYRLDRTLRALETAAATTATGRTDIGPGGNPVALLDRPPARYRGERSGLAPADAEPGSWYYDPNAGTLIHRPEDPTLLTPVTDPPAGALPHLRLRLEGGDGRRLHLRRTGPWRYQGRSRSP